MRSDRVLVSGEQKERETAADDGAMVGSRLAPPIRERDKGAMQSARPSGGRIAYMDNLRIYLTCLVVAHHVAIGYGGSGGWAVKETPTDPVTPILFLVFNAINQSYFMSLFFLLSGWFLPQSYDRKGPAKCLNDRLIRLGVPLLAYVLIIAPLVSNVVANVARGEHISIFGTLMLFVRAHRVNVGPLWFVETLLIFSVVYILFRVVRDRFFPAFAPTPFKDGFPADRSIVASIVAIALATFAVRTVFPIGVWIHHFQLAHFVHYIFCFWLGIAAYRGGWLDRLTKAEAKRWGFVALWAILFLLAVIGVNLASGGDLGAFMGGVTWQAFVTAAWESVACLSIIISLLYLFMTRFDRQPGILKSMSANAYTVYIIHELIIVSLMAVLLHVRMLTFQKFIVVILFGLPLCFLVSHFFVRRLPCARRVLG